MRPIDADAMRKEWLENGENEYVYDTNAVLDSIDCQPTLTADDYFDAVDRIKPCPNCRYTLFGALTEDEPRWIPVTERLPENPMERVLVEVKDTRNIHAPDRDTDRYANGKWVRWGESVTRWMPLPSTEGLDG